MHSFTQFSFHMSITYFVSMSVCQLVTLSGKGGGMYQSFKEKRLVHHVKFSTKYR